MENLVNLPSTDFWTGKRVLITGHTGFKGSWLCHWLLRMGSEVTGIALANEQSPNLFTLLELDKKINSCIADLRNGEHTRQLIKATNPEIIFHLAAQPLVREIYRLPVETFATNVLGTVHLLDAVRHTPSIKGVVVVTTDKVYQNREWLYPYREIDRLGGLDPYSASKAACELVADSYRHSYFNQANIGLTTVRAGNVFGGGDWSAERLVPDILRAWSSGRCLSIRSPNAVRPWQHVIEPICAYLKIAENLQVNTRTNGAFNIGPNSSDHVSVLSLIQKFRAAYGSGEYRIESSDPDMHEASLLSLDNSRARAILSIKPRWNVDHAVTKTVNWHKNMESGIPASELCDADIDSYEGKND